MGCRAHLKLIARIKRLMASRRQAVPGIVFVHLIKGCAYGSKREEDNVESRYQKRDSEPQVEQDVSDQTVPALLERFKTSGGEEIRIVPGQKDDGQGR